MKIAGRVPPQSLDGETAVLGAMLLERQAIGRAEAILTPEDFYRQAHGLIADTVWVMHRKREPVDLTTLASALENRGILESVGGRPYLAGLLDAVPTAAHVEHYARIVARHAALRRLIALGTDLIEECYGEVEDAGEVASRYALRAGQIARDPNRDTSFLLKEGLEEALKRYEELAKAPKDVSGIPTGLRDLDRATHGLQRGDVHVIAGRPGMGKTALWMTVLKHAVLTGHSCLAFSLEMSRSQLQDRVMQMASGVDGWRLRTGHLQEGHWPDLVNAVNLFWESVAKIDHTAGISLHQIRNRARLWKAERGLDLLIVDYAQLIRVPGNHDNETQKLSQVSEELKVLAGELDCALLLLSQLNRQVEARDDKRPRMSDLRQSGRLEEDAAMVALLYRPSYYARKALADSGEDVEDPDQDPVEFIIAKNRHGADQMIPLVFRPRLAAFENLEE